MINFTANDTYEYSDLNRVETSIQEASEQFLASGFPNTIITPKLNWSISSLPIVADFNRIEENFKNLDIPETFEQKSWYERRPFDYNDANRWEYQSELITLLKNNIRRTWPVCGAAVCGNGGL